MCHPKNAAGSSKAGQLQNDTIGFTLAHGEEHPFVQVVVRFGGGLEPDDRPKVDQGRVYLFPARQGCHHLGWGVAQALAINPNKSPVCSTDDIACVDSGQAIGADTLFIGPAGQDCSGQAWPDDRSAQNGDDPCLAKSVISQDNRTANLHAEFGKDGHSARSIAPMIGGSAFSTSTENPDRRL